MRWERILLVDLFAQKLVMERTGVRGICMVGESMVDLEVQAAFVLTFGYLRLGEEGPCSFFGVSSAHFFQECWRRMVLSWVSVWVAHRHISPAALAWNCIW